MLQLASELAPSNGLTGSYSRKVESFLKFVLIRQLKVFSAALDVIPIWLDLVWREFTHREAGAKWKWSPSEDHLTETMDSEEEEEEAETDQNVHFLEAVFLRVIPAR